MKYSNPGFVFNFLSPVLSVLALAVTWNAAAYGPPGQMPLPDLDQRISRTDAINAVTTQRTLAVTQLQAKVPTIAVEFNPVTGTPRSISAGAGFLSGTNGFGKAISTAPAAGVALIDANRITRAFLQEHRQIFGHDAAVLDKARLKRNFVTAHNGLQTIVWEQLVDGIPVFESLLVSHTTRSGKLVNLSSGFLPDAETAANQSVPNRQILVSIPDITARLAVAAAAQNIGEDITEDEVSSVNNPTIVSGPEQAGRFSAESLKGDAEARLIWLPLNADSLRMCWDVVLSPRSRGEMYRVLIDAQTGEAMLRRCLTEYISSATYSVYTNDSPSPFSPGHSTPNSGQPSIIARSSVTLSAVSITASPNGWIDDGVNETRGNNVDAHLDRNADNQPDLPRPQGSPSRVFNPAMDLSQSPTTYGNAATVQLFYWCNWMHDKLYELGFTEAAGNFQNNNFGRGGFGNDAVQADAQDGSGVNNANFSTPPDGFAGRMQMYVFTGPSPDRDGDFDAEIILHEYAHGLSNRRVGGGVGLSALQSRGMGEGWSDFYGLALLSQAGDNVNGVYASGGYATYQLSGLTQNYYYGIRRYPYSTDLNKNPLTFKDINPTQASSHPGVPRSPIIDNTANEVHNMGEVWCATLWEARANLINKHGWTVGNQLILQLVTDGMNLSPANPNFLQARDAILQADQVNNNGANQGELWSAFAKRGMGFSATSPSSSTTTGLFESYDIPFQPLLISLISSATESNGTLVGAGQVQIPTSVISNVVVHLSSSDLSEATVPAMVTILAGQTNAAFNLTVVDDAELDGPQSVTITASASGYADDYQNLTIYDNETATLQVNLPGSAVKDQGTVSGTVQVNLAPTANVAVTLSSSDTNRLQVPATVNFPAGQTSAVLVATIVNNGAIDGPHNATVTAHVQNWTDGADTITLLDNLNLAVNLPANILENIGTLTNAGSISIAGTLTTNLMVSLVSDNASLSVPATAIISAGQISAAFNLTLVDNSLSDGNRAASVTASAPGFTNGSAPTMIIDDDTPPIIITQPASQLAAVGTTLGLNVVVSGGQPLHYQWLKNGTELSGATNANYTIFNAQTNHSGTYHVLVTNIFGSATSSNAVLTVVVVPIITSFDPVSGAANDLITINGGGFSPNVASNVVYFGSVVAQVLSASQTNLVVKVPMGSLHAPLSVTVNGLTAWSGRPFLMTFPGNGVFDSSSLASRVDIGSGNGPQRVAIGDLDGDGKPDLVIAHVFDATVRIYRNIGSPGTLNGSSLATPVVLPPVGAGGDTIYGLDLSDVNGDGKLDVVIADRQDNRVFIFQNQAAAGTLTTNSFGSRVDLPVTGQPMGLAVRDLDGDGKPEVITGNNQDNTVSVLRNIGTGGVITTNMFAAPVNFAVGTGPFRLKTADIDGDGKLDVVTVNNNNSSQAISVLRNTASYGVISNNSFAARIDFAGPNSGEAVDVGDVDGDGKVDVVASSPGGGIIFLYRNTSSVSSISLAAAVSFNAGGTVHCVTLGDLNGDAKPDIAVTVDGANKLSVFKNTSVSGTLDSSSLAARVDFSSANNPDGVIIGDLDGDSRPDVVTANVYGANFSLFRNVASFGGPPTILISPTNQTVYVGENATFNVTAEGTTPLSYQWKLNGTNLLNETNTTLTLLNVQLNQAGNYTVQVTNLLGMASSNALLTVLAVPPTITNQPTSLSVVVGDTANFSVTATGTVPLSYQWRFNGTNLLNQTNTTLTLLNVQLNQAGNYTVLVTNLGGNVLSSNAVLTVTSPQPPTITSQPTNQTVLLGGTALFSVTATGTPPLSYQWRVNGTNLLNQTNATLTLLNVQFNQASSNYLVLITNTFGSTFSSNALLLVNPLPTNVPVITGFNPAAEKPGAAITVSGLNFSPNVASNLVYFGSVVGEVQSANQTNLMVKVPMGGLHAPLSVTVNGLTAWSGRPFLMTFPGTNVFNSSSLSARVDIGSGNGPQRVAIGDLDGDGKPDLVIAHVFDATVLIYRNIGTPGTLNSTTFATAVVLPVVGSGGDTIYGVELCDVNGDGKLDIIIANRGNNRVSIFQNQATAGTLTTNSFGSRVDLPVTGQPMGLAVRDLDGDGKPEVITGNNQGNTVSVLRNIGTGGVITTNMFAVPVNFAVGPGPFKLNTADIDGDGKLDVVTINNGNSSQAVSVLRNTANYGVISTNSFAAKVDLSGPNSGEGVAVGDVDGDGKVDVVASSPGGGIIFLYRNTSSVSSISMAAPVSFSAGGTVHSVTLGDLNGDAKPDIAVTVDGANKLSVFKNTSVSGTLNSSSLAARVDFSSADNPDGVIIGDLDGDDRPDVVTANVYGANFSLFRNLPLTPLYIVTQPNSQIVTVGSNVTFTVIANGSTSLSYQWRFNGTNISGATGNSYIRTNVQVTDTGNYSVIVTNLAGSVISSNAILTVMLPPVITAHPTNQTVYVGGNATFSVTAGGTLPLVYQWRLNGTNLIGQTNATLALVNVQFNQAGNYTVQVTNLLSAVSSSNAVLTVLAMPPSITSQPTNQSVFVGDNTSFSVIATGIMPLKYQWKFNDTNLLGQTNATLALLDVQLNQAGTYAVVVTNVGGNVMSSNAILTVTLPVPLVITSQPTNQTVFTGSTAIFNVTADGTPPLSYQWKFNGTNLVGATNETLALANVQFNQAGSNYVVQVSDSFDSVLSSNATLTVVNSLVVAWGSNSDGQTNVPLELTDVIAIAAGGYHSVALQAGGSTTTWGYPVMNGSSEFTNVISVSAGHYHSIALYADGSVIARGNNDYNQTNVPPNLTNAAAIAAGGYHSLALKDDGSVIAWGNNDFDQANVPPNLTNVVAISAGEYHSLVLRKDGSVVAWGLNLFGQTDLPAGLSNIIAITAGGYHSLALKTDGAIIAWGYNAFGQTNVPTGLTNTVAIAAGGYHSLALGSDGSVVAWGYDADGQATVPSNLTNVVAISAGGFHSLAILKNTPPVLHAPVSNVIWHANSLHLSLPSQSGRAYQLEYKNSLEETNWAALLLSPGNGGLLILVDITATNSQRFYRVRQW